MMMPYFSIIVPTFDRPQALAACVQALRELDYPHDRMEIIVVDDGSRIPVVTSDYHREKIASTVFRQANAGPAAARNLGARHARGDILAFTDDDCRPAPSWLRELARSFHDAPTGLIGGRTVNRVDNSLCSAASQMIVDEAYAYFSSRNSDLRFFASNNMALSAKLFREIGGFDPSFRTSEDRELCDRWIGRGQPLAYSPEALVYHHHYLTLPAFCRQHFNYGRGAHRFHRVRARRSRSALKPDLTFYASVCRHTLFKPWSWKSLRLAGLMGLWQAANLAGFLWQALRRDHHDVAGLTGDEELSGTTGDWRTVTNQKERRD